jgi:hypothetical protein
MSKKWLYIDTEEQLTCVRITVQVLRTSRSNIEPMDGNFNSKTRKWGVSSEIGPGAEFKLCLWVGLRSAELICSKDATHG